MALLISAQVLLLIDPERIFVLNTQVLVVRENTFVRPQTSENDALLLLGSSITPTCYHRRPVRQSLAFFLPGMQRADSGTNKTVWW